MQSVLKTMIAAFLVALAMLSFGSSARAQSEPTTTTTTVVWQTHNAQGQADGFITATQNSSGSWTWQRFRNNPDGSHEKIDEGTATQSGSNPTTYTWTGTTSGHSGTATLDSGNTTGVWRNNNTETEIKIKKIS